MNGSKAYGKSLTDGDIAGETGEGLGQGVQSPENYDVGEEGFKCLGKMPVTGGFFTREPKHGQP
jgi:hypothetical protein